MCLGNVSEASTSGKPVSPAIPKLGFKVGDKVKVLRSAVKGEFGWKNAWVSEMDSAIGLTGVVTAVYENNQDIAVKIPGIMNNYGYPTSSLELVKEPIPAPVVPETGFGFTVGQRVKNRGGGFGIVTGFRNAYVEVKRDGHYYPTSWFPTSLTPFVSADQPVARPVVQQFVSTQIKPVNVARDLAVKLARQNPAKTVTIDWVQEELAKLGFKSTDLGNAAGVIFKSKQFRNTGTTAKSVRPGNNHRRITVWQYVGEGPVEGRFIVEAHWGDGWGRSGNPGITITGVNLYRHVFSNLESATKEAEAQQRDQGREYRAVPLP